MYGAQDEVCCCAGAGPIRLDGATSWHRTKNHTYRHWSNMIHSTTLRALVQCMQTSVVLVPDTVDGKLRPKLLILDHACVLTVVTNQAR